MSTPPNEADHEGAALPDPGAMGDLGAMGENPDAAVPQMPLDMLAALTQDDEPKKPSLQDVLAERDSYLEDLQRVTAEFANFRRRTAERQQESVVAATAKMAEAVLPVLDACDAALLQGSEEVAPIRNVLLDVLTKQGLVRLGAPGDPFDPECHEAVAHTEGDDTQSAVVDEVLRPGYVLNGKVLRPAMVHVRG